MGGDVREQAPHRLFESLDIDTREGRTRRKLDGARRVRGAHLADDATDERGEVTRLAGMHLHTVRQLSASHVEELLDHPLHAHAARHHPLEPRMTVGLELFAQCHHAHCSEDGVERIEQVVPQDAQESLLERVARLGTMTRVLLTYHPGLELLFNLAEIAQGVVQRQLEFLPPFYLFSEHTIALLQEGYLAHALVGASE